MERPFEIDHDPPLSPKIGFTQPVLPKLDRAQSLMAFIKKLPPLSPLRENTTQVQNSSNPKKTLPRSKSLKFSLVWNRFVL